MRILFITASVTGGGAEKVVTILTDAMSRRGLEVHLLIYERYATEYPIGEKVIVHSLPPGNDNPVVRKVGKLGRIRRVVSDVNPDVVISFVEQVSIIAHIGLPSMYISTIRCDPLSQPYNRFQRWYRNILCYFSDAVFVQTLSQKGYFPKFMHSKIFAIHNPVSGKLLAAPKEHREQFCEIVTAGRLLKRKNHKLLIDAFNEVAKSHQHIKLLIYGEGPEKYSLESYIKTLGLEEKVILKGRTNDILRALQSADLFVLPSDYEGMPNALMEAMAVSLPCISTDCKTGPADLIESEKNGLLVSVGSVEEMVCAMKKMLSDTKEANQMGEAARRTMKENFSEDNIAALLEKECKFRLK